MEISPDEVPWKSIYKIMIGSIVPRPIGWISSLSQEGKANLAPFSFFNAVCANPPTILFCPGVRSSDRQPKDTLFNVRETGEFVVNIVTAPLAQAMNVTSTELPGEIDEFIVAGLTKSPSMVIRPPRVAESPVHFECRVHQIIEIGTEPGGGSVVIGDVVHIHVDQDVLFGTDKIDPQRLKAVGRMGGPTYCHTNDLFDMIRPPSQIT